MSLIRKYMLVSMTAITFLVCPARLAHSKHSADARQIKLIVKKLDYSEVIADRLCEMVGAWKDAKGGSQLRVLAQELNNVRERGKTSASTASQLEQAECKIAQQVTEMITREIARGDFFHLADVIDRKKAQCVGYSQLLFIVATTVGFKIQPILVEELPTGKISISPRLIWQRHWSWTRVLKKS